MVLVSWAFRRATPSRVDRWFRRLQLISAGAYSLGHGGNDAQKTIGIIWMMLIATGYGLYYLGNDSVRDPVSLAHWLVGLGMPALMGCHIWLGRASRKLRHTAAASAAKASADESEQALRLVRKP